MSTGIIVNLDNVVDSVVSANVNVIAANQAVVDATTQAVIATNQVSLAQAEVVAAGQQADAAEAQANIAAAQASLAANSVVEAQAKVDLVEAYKAAIEIIAANVEGLQTLTANDRALVASYMAATATYRDAADASKTLAQDALEHFQNVYLGALPQAPVNALDTNGTPIEEGALYWDTYWKALKIYNGAGWSFFNYAGALTVAGNLSDLSDFAEARANLDVMSTSEVGAAIAGAGLSLGTNYTVNDNTEKDALTGLTVSDKVFVHDDGDGKWAIYYTIAVTDGLGSTSTFKVIMDEDTYLNANTAASIKASYESNADTNVFSDADKSKLDGIEAGATADQVWGEIGGDLSNQADIVNEFATKQDVLVSGVNIRTVNNRDLVGSGNVDITVGSGGYAGNVYFTELVSTTNPAYKQVSYTPDSLETINSVIVNNNEVLLGSYIYDSDVKASSIPAGEWGFHIHRWVDNNAQETKIRFEIFSRTSGGVETNLFSVSTLDINDTVSTLEVLLITKDAFTVNETDRIGIRVYANTTRTSDTTVSFKSGDGQASYFVTPLQVRHSLLRARDEVDSHPASAIAVTPQGNLSSDNVQSALEELQSNIDTITIITEW